MSLSACTHSWPPETPDIPAYDIPCKWGDPLCQSWLTETFVIDSSLCQLFPQNWMDTCYLPMTYIWHFDPLRHPPEWVQYDGWRFVCESEYFGNPAVTQTAWTDGQPDEFWLAEAPGSSVQGICEMTSAAETIGRIGSQWVHLVKPDAYAPPSGENLYRWIGGGTPYPELIGRCDVILHVTIPDAPFTCTVPNQLEESEYNENPLFSCNNWNHPWVGEFDFVRREIWRSLYVKSCSRQLSGSPIPALVGLALLGLGAVAWPAALKLQG